MFVTSFAHSLSLPPALYKLLRQLLLAPSSMLPLYPFCASFHPPPPSHTFNKVSTFYQTSFSYASSFCLSFFVLYYMDVQSSYRLPSFLLSSRAQVHLEQVDPIELFSHITPPPPIFPPLSFFTLFISSSILYCTALSGRGQHALYRESTSGCCSGRHHNYLHCRAEIIQ